MFTRGSRVHVSILRDNYSSPHYLTVRSRCNGNLNYTTSPQTVFEIEEDQGKILFSHGPYYLGLRSYGFVLTDRLEKALTLEPGWGTLQAGKIWFRPEAVGSRYNFLFRKNNVKALILSGQINQNQIYDFLTNRNGSTEKVSEEESVEAVAVEANMEGQDNGLQNWVWDGENWNYRGAAIPHKPTFPAPPGNYPPVSDQTMNFAPPVSDQTMNFAPPISGQTMNFAPPVEYQATNYNVAQSINSTCTGNQITAPDGTCQSCKQGIQYAANNVCNNCAKNAKCGDNKYCNGSTGSSQIPCVMDPITGQYSAQCPANAGCGGMCQGTCPGRVFGWSCQGSNGNYACSFDRSKWWAMLLWVIFFLLVIIFLGWLIHRLANQNRKSLVVTKKSVTVPGKSNVVAVSQTGSTAPLLTASLPPMTYEVPT